MDKRATFLTLFIILKQVKNTYDLLMSVTSWRSKHSLSLVERRTGPLGGLFKGFQELAFINKCIA